MRIDNADFHAAGTLNGTRRNITKVTKSGWQEQLWIADGKLYCSKAGRGSTSWTSVAYATDPPANTFRRGVEQMWEVPFPPNESGNLLDADVYATSAWALFDNGNLYTWGYNAYGQLGVGDTTERYVPTLSNTGVTKVYSHISNSQRSTDTQRLYILKAGELWGCGYNGFGQLGDGTTTSRSVWTKITAAGTNPKSVWNLGNYTGCLFVQKSDNTIFVCGYNGFGQLGNNSTTNITSLTNLTNAWTGNDSTMVIQDVQGGFGYNDGTTQVENCNVTMFLDNGTTSRIASCGANNWGSLGDTTTTQRQIPVTPTGFSGRVRKIIRVGDAPGGVWALKTDGTLWNWGYNAYGQLDRGNTTQNQSTPTQVEIGILDIQESFMAGQSRGYYSNSPYVQKANGSWWQCGLNDFGQLADGTATQRTNLVRMWFPNGTVIKHFATNNATTWGTTRFAVTDDNRIYAWGYNELYTIHEANASNVWLPLSVNPNILQR
jgi:alpha-tubulin suppressor-like RCC1 family protein